jgi:hypothetical protein
LKDAFGMFWSRSQVWKRYRGTSWGMGWWYDRSGRGDLYDGVVSELYLRDALMLVGV